MSGVAKKETMSGQSAERKSPKGRHADGESPNTIDQRLTRFKTLLRGPEPDSSTVKPVRMRGKDKSQVEIR